MNEKLAVRPVCTCDELFERQIKLLKTFLSHGAISKPGTAAAPVIWEKDRKAAEWGRLTEERTHILKVL